MRVTVGAQQACALDLCVNYVEAAGEVIDYAPDLVIVSGGRNDRALPIATVRSNTDELFRELRAALPDATIVATSPVWHSTSAPDSLAVIGAAVEKSVTAAGGTYLDIGEPLNGRPELIHTDGVHPNDAGHKVLAAAVTDALRRVGLL
jgi:lysophospholipase L1-like esterase